MLTKLLPVLSLVCLAIVAGHHRRYPVDEAARALVPQESAA